MMEIKTFRAKTMQQALDQVRTAMGPEATVLHTRELNRGLVSRWLRGREYEIAASSESRFSEASPGIIARPEPPNFRSNEVSPPSHDDYGVIYRNHFQSQTDCRFTELHQLSQQLHERHANSSDREMSEAFFQVYTDLIEADIDESLAQELMQRLKEQTFVDRHDPIAMRAEAARFLEEEFSVTGPIQPAAKEGRVVALVGPTGVGKTTTIAKLAANFRLRENRRVGLITVDTYRIAAVEQLRTYADIIDLPMEVVSTPREMREAVARMRDFDLVLMDTAGRSPRDEVKIQELKSMLAEAEPAEVHLVLSAVGGARSLVSTAERFSSVGTTAMLVTKLDEATGLGNLLSVARSCPLPISYLTDGQNVPDDIQVAESKQVAQLMLRQHLA